MHGITLIHKHVLYVISVAWNENYIVSLNWQFPPRLLPLLAFQCPQSQKCPECGQDLSACSCTRTGHSSEGIEECADSPYCGMCNNPVCLCEEEQCPCSVWCSNYAKFRKSDISSSSIISFLGSHCFLHPELK